MKRMTKNPQMMNTVTRGSNQLFMLDIFFDDVDAVIGSVFVVVGVGNDCDNASVIVDTARMPLQG